MEKFMKALVVKEDSQGQTIEFSDVPIPLPEPGQALIKVHVTPIHYSDAETTQGNVSNRFSSVIPGIEGSGIVVAGPKSMFFSKNKGKKVSFMQLDSSLPGAWAEYIVCNEKYFMVLNDNIDFLRGSTLMINPLTILMFHEKIQKKNHKFLIHSNAGTDLGLILIKWCHYNDITGIHIVKNDAEYQKAKLVSPDYILVQESPNFLSELTELCNKLKPTLCFDSIGGALAGELFNLLQDSGEMYLYGNYAKDQITGLNPSGYIFGQKKLEGLRFKNWFDELGSVNRYKYYKKIQKVSFVLSTSVVNVYPINQYKEALSTFSLLGTTLLHFACNLQTNSKIVNEDILSQYISESLQSKINSLPVYSFSGPEYPIKVISEGIYKGEVIENKPNGKGILLFNNTYYIGDFIQGKKDGFGRIVTDEYWYEGNWKNDEFFGAGKYSNFSGHCLEGVFKNNKLNDQGVETLSSGEVYKGEFLNGLRHGHGEIDFNNIKFVGEFKNGEAEGDGKVELENGSVFVGFYTKGVGIGELISKDGSKVKGNMIGNVFAEIKENEHKN